MLYTLYKLIDYDMTFNLTTQVKKNWQKEQLVVSTNTYS
jgi:hypothetical protein